MPATVSDLCAQASGSNLPSLHEPCLLAQPPSSTIHSSRRKSTLNHIGSSLKLVIHLARLRDHMSSVHLKDDQAHSCAHSILQSKERHRSACRIPFHLLKMPQLHVTLKESVGTSAINLPNDILASHHLWDVHDRPCTAKLLAQPRQPHCPTGQPTILERLRGLRSYQCRSNRLSTHLPVIVLYCNHLPYMVSRFCNPDIRKI